MARSVMWDEPGILSSSTMPERLVRHPASLSWQLGLVAALFGGWVLAYFWAFGDSAWHPTDYEHVAAFTYRFAHGEVPYRDFIYHKPPGTLLIHVVWHALPDSIEVRASRLFVLSQIAATGLIPLLWALARGCVRFGWRLGALGCATTSIALHNFPIMPWQTIDGVFFAMLGWVALLESSWVAQDGRALIARATASALLGFALLCKQSFILIFGAFAVYSAAEALWFLRRRVKAAPIGLRLASSVLPASLLFAAVLIWLFATGALPHFLAELSSESTPGAFWRVLSGPYRDVDYLWVMLAWMVVPALRLVDGLGARALAARALALWPLGLLAQDIVKLTGNATGRLGPTLMVSLAGITLGQCLLGAIALATSSERLPHPAFNPWMMLLSVGILAGGLSCQVSLGYTTPILGLAAFGVILHGLLPDERFFWLDLMPAVVVAWLALVGMWGLCAQPYRDGPRPELTQNLGELFPRLSGVHTTPANFERYAALKQIVTERILPAGRPFATLQDYPGVHWLFGTRNPIAIDWNWPLDAAGFEGRIIDDLERTNAVAIVPKSHDADWGELSLADDTPCSRLDTAHHTVASRYVVQRWRLIGENRFFCLFSR
jgi:hypothetical protein